tara:strand:- start:28 stop:654 length:627 start_codon:yes stop_codon:yes gene_type:complete
MKVIRPFGPSIAKVSIPENLIKKLNDYIDQIISSTEKIKLQDHGNKLAGNVTQEFKLEKDFINSSGLENFLNQNAKEWIKQTIKREINKCDIIDSWIVRQFENEYNPLHSHSGHISGVGYLKVPDDFGETVQKNKKENFNGHLQLVHGAKMFLSPVMLNIEPKVGDFYFFPNYLMHTVYPFKNKSAERRSISFNALIDQEIYGNIGKI